LKTRIVPSVVRKWAEHEERNSGVDSGLLAALCVSYLLKTCTSLSKAASFESGEEPKKEKKTAAQRQTAKFKKRHGTVTNFNTKFEALLRVHGWGGTKNIGGVRAVRGPSLYQLECRPCKTRTSF